MLAITPTAQPTTPTPVVPTFSLPTLRQALAALHAEQPEHGARLDRAAAILATRTLERFGTGWLVESETLPGQYYLVSRDGYGARCLCPDYRERGGLACKHILAVTLLARCERLETDTEQVARDAGNVTPFPVATLDPDAPIPFELTAKALAELDRPDPEDPEPTPIRGSRLGDGSYWGQCKLCGDIGVIAYNGRGVCCVN
jgi:hypothetical protein